MWSDNEADIDLLGFDYLVDELLAALTTEDLLPLTVGVLGEWGSGKSSLLKIAQRELDALKSPAFLTVGFSPWQHEDYDDVKLALMTRVLAACEERGADPKRIRGLKKFMAGLTRVGRTTGRVLLNTAPAFAGTVATAIDPTNDPTTTAVVTKAMSSTAEALLAEIGEGEPEDIVPVSTLADFRSKFSEMVEGLEVQAVVVFIDDLDRCLPNTVVQTFEAIRLFLNTPKTAFVIASHRQIAEAAIDAAFPDYARLNGPGLGHDYLEKMLQVQVSVPTLSPEDLSSYVGLLLSKLHVSAEIYDAMCAEVAARRLSAPFDRAFDLTFAAEFLGDEMPAGLGKDLAWAEEVVPAVSSALRGNPRQTKRFLNDVRLREHASKRRGVALEPAVLAKLMVLEEIDFAALQTLFDWQLAVSGPIPELASAETPTHAAPPATAVVKMESADAAPKRSRAVRAVEPEAEPDAVAIWRARPTVRKWLELSPKLGGTDLRTYFTFFRSTLTFNTQVSRLPETLKIVLQELTSDQTATRRKGINTFRGLDPAQQDSVWEVLDANVRQRPESASWDASVEIGAVSPRHGEALVVLLSGLPDRVIPAAKVPSLYKRLPEGSGREELISKWAKSSVGPLEAAASAIERMASR